MEKDYIMGYGIQCHLRKTLNHVTHPEGKVQNYTFLEEGWIYDRDLIDKVCKKLEKKYKDYIFWPEIHFFDKNIILYDKARLPAKPLIKIE